MKRVLGILSGAGLLAASMVFLPAPAQAVDYDVWSYDSTVHFDNNPTGEDLNVDRFRMRNYFKRGPNGSSWILRGVVLDGWEKGNDPNNVNSCGQYMQWIEVNWIKVYEGTSLVWQGGPRDLTDDNGCDNTYLSGTAQVLVNSNFMRVKIDYNIHVALRNDFNGEQMEQTYQITGSTTNRRECHFLTGHGEYCQTNGPFNDDKMEDGTKRPPNG